jgi:hypothetical protein
LLLACGAVDSIESLREAKRMILLFTGNTSYPIDEFSLELYFILLVVKELSKFGFAACAFIHYILLDWSFVHEQGIFE